MSNHVGETEEINSHLRLDMNGETKEKKKESHEGVHNEDPVQESLRRSCVIPCPSEIPHS